MNNTQLLLLVGKRIKQARKNKHLSQLELAYSLNMSATTISYIELGKVATTITTLNKIANELNIDLYTFFKINEKKEQRKEQIEKIKKELDKLL